MSFCRLSIRAEATEKARHTVDSWEQFIRDHRDDITALQILYNQPYGSKDLNFKEIKELAQAINVRPTVGRPTGCGMPTERSKPIVSEAPVLDCSPILCHSCAMHSTPMANSSRSLKSWPSGTRHGSKSRRLSDARLPMSSECGWTASVTT